LQAVVEANAVCNAAEATALAIGGGSECAGRVVGCAGDVVNGVAAGRVHDREHPARRIRRRAAGCGARIGDGGDGTIKIIGVTHGLGYTGNRAALARQAALLSSISFASSLETRLRFIENNVLTQLNSVPRKLFFRSFRLQLTPASPGTAALRRKVLVVALLL
jgi:hypothetical protein